jgi:methyl-accepting chemotaxis protein
MNIKNLRIGVRLGIGFGLVIVAAVLIALIGRLALGVARDDVRQIGTAMAGVNAVHAIENNLNISGRALRTMLLLDDAERIEMEKERVLDARTSNEEALQQLEAIITDADGKALVAQLADKRVRFDKATDEVLEVMVSGTRSAATEVLLGEGRFAHNAFAQALAQVAKRQDGIAAQVQAGAESTVASSGAVMLALAAVASLLGAFVAWFTTVSVTRPLSQAVTVTNVIAQGDLTSHIDAGSRDEVGQLLIALQTMQTNLRRIVGEVRVGVESVSTASSQIAAGNQDLSSRTEQQASSLQQTAASMEQLATTVRQNSETATQANQLAASASSAAVAGGSVVGEVVNTMQGISAASHKIADIINVIDGIAFQTNILALNAAVEAARAGEQGRGFAVVAGEVRNLAQRSAQAAREIKSLISDSVSRVDAGGRLVNQAGEAMQDIVAQVRRVSEMIGEITAATVQQTGGIGQVNSAVTQLDQVTQQNAALVEQSAAAAASMKAQASQLAQSVAVFRLGDAAPRVAPT